MSDTTDLSFAKLFNMDFNSKGEMVNKGLNRKQRRKLGIRRNKYKNILKRG